MLKLLRLVFISSFVTDAAKDGCMKELEAVRFEASSAYQYSVGAHHAPLRNEQGGGAWCPQSLIKKDSETKEFLEMVLEEEHLITSVITQGRFADGLGQEFAEHIVLQYWRPGLENYRQYINSRGDYILPANRDTHSEVQIKLEKPFVAAKVRILPFSFHSRTVCMRVGLTGCPVKGDDVRETELVEERQAGGGKDGGSEKEVIRRKDGDMGKGDISRKDGDMGNEDIRRKDQEMGKEDIRRKDEVPGIPDGDAEKNGSGRKNEVEGGDGGGSGGVRWTSVEDNTLRRGRMEGGDLDTSYLGIAVGVLVSVILVLISIILFILYKNYNLSRREGGGEEEQNLEPRYEGTNWSRVYGSYMKRGVKRSPPSSEENYTDSSGDYGSPLFTRYAEERKPRSLEVFCKGYPTQKRPQIYNNRIYYPVGSENTEYTTLELLSTLDKSETYQSSSPARKPFPL